MRVICIDNSPGKFGHAAFLVVMKEYLVKQCDFYDDAYDVDGLLFDPRNGDKICFRKRHFIPLSDIDETEFATTHLKEKV